MTSVLGGKTILGITLLMMMGILASCVPEEDAVELTGAEEVEVENGDDYLRIGDKQILWGKTSTTNVTFSVPFSETPTISAVPTTVSGYTTTVSVTVNNTGFTLSSLSTPSGNTIVHWQAIGKYK